MRVLARGLGLLDERDEVEGREEVNMLAVVLLWPFARLVVGRTARARRWTARRC